MSNLISTKGGFFGTKTSAGWIVLGVLTPQKRGSNKLTISAGSGNDYFAVENGTKPFSTKRILKLTEEILKIPKERRIREMKKFPKKDLLQLPFWLYGELSEADSIFFYNFHIMKYKNLYNFTGDPKSEKRWTHTEQFPLERFLKYDFKKLHTMIYGKESQCINPEKKYCRNASPIGPNTVHSFKNFLKTVQKNLKKLGFSEKNSKFMSVKKSKK